LPQSPRPSAAGPNFWKNFVDFSVMTDGIERLFRYCCGVVLLVWR
jgi:hypothetical protein